MSRRSTKQRRAAVRRKRWSVWKNVYQTYTITAAELAQNPKPLIDAIIERETQFAELLKKLTGDA